LQCKNIYHVKNGDAGTIAMQEHLQFRRINDVRTNGIGDAIVIAMQQHL
jgi:hypothetical protein